MNLPSLRVKSLLEFDNHVTQGIVASSRESMDMKALLIASIFLANFLTFNAHSAAPSCSSASGGFCQYTGKVEKIYINNAGIILLYFDSLASISNAQVAGFTITHVQAAAYEMSENPDFAKMFYSTALAAQASGRDVTIQMHGTYAGYLKISRIWLQAPNS